MNHAEQAFLKPSVAKPTEKSLKDATLEDLSLKKQAAVTGGLSDKQKDTIFAELANESRAGLYAQANMSGVLDMNFDSLTDEEQLAQFHLASKVFEKTVVSNNLKAQQTGDEQVLNQMNRAQEILNLDPEKLKFARDTIRTYREKIVTAEAAAQKSFERIQQLQAQHAQAVESNSPDAGKIDAQLSAEIINNEALDAAVRRHETFVAAAEVAFEKAFNIPSGSTTKEKA